jgi:hypothetical protein
MHAGVYQTILQGEASSCIQEKLQFKPINFNTDKTSIQSYTKV